MNKSVLESFLLLEGIGATATAVDAVVAVSSDVGLVLLALLPVFALLVPVDDDDD